MATGRTPSGRGLLHPRLLVTTVGVTAALVLGAGRSAAATAPRS